MLAQAAFYIRFTNRALNITTCCLPIFFVRDMPKPQWGGECFLVYEEAETDRVRFSFLYCSIVRLTCHSGPLSSFAIPFSTRRTH